MNEIMGELINEMQIKQIYLSSHTESQNLILMLIENILILISIDKPKNYNKYLAKILNYEDFIKINKKEINELKKFYLSKINDTSLTIESKMEKHGFITMNVCRIILEIELELKNKLIPKIEKNNKCIQYYKKI